MFSLMTQGIFVCLWLVDCCAAGHGVTTWKFTQSWSEKKSCFFLLQSRDSISIHVHSTHSWSTFTSDS